MIKYRSFHYYIEEPILAGGTGLVEHLAFFGETVDIPREEDVQRGEMLDAFFTDDEVEAIKEGTYDGPEAELLGMKLTGSGFPTVPPFSQDEEIRTGPPIDAAGMTSEELHEYIVANNLTVSQTVALAEGDVEVAERLLDAENMAGAPRPEVVVALEQVGAEPTVVPEEVPETDTPPGNASRAEWEEFATLQGIEFPEDATRDDIIAAVNEARAIS